jgi:hypothetical protein
MPPKLVLVFHGRTQVTPAVVHSQDELLAGVNVAKCVLRIEVFTGYKLPLALKKALTDKLMEFWPFEDDESD